MVDAFGRITLVNAQIEKIFGYRREELLGQPIELLVPARFREGHVQYRKDYTGKPEVRAMGHGRDLYGRRKNGDEISVEIGLNPLPTPEGMFVLASVIDITERKRREEELRRKNDFISAVLDTTQALVVVLDRSGRIVEFNRTCEEVSGYSRNEVAGKVLWEALLPPEDVDYIRGVIVDLFHGGPVTRGESTWITKTGDRRLLNWTRAVLRDPAGKPEYVISTGLDITERRRLENLVLEVAKKEQQRIGQELHDGLGQQLTSTAIMAKVLEKKLRKAELKEADQAAEIVSLLNRATTHTRELAQGLYALDVAPEDFAAAVKRFAAETERRFEVACDVSIDERLAVSDHSVATHLFRIVSEAVNNALKHAKPKRISIHLGAEEGRFLRLVIDNDGLAFHDPQGEAEGMGLRIMAYRARLIGGTFDIRARKGGGTVVTCEVPIGRAEAIR